MSETTNQDADTALESLRVAAMRVKEERDSLLAAAKSLVSLIDSTVLVFDAEQLKWLQRKPAYERLCNAINNAEAA